MATVLFAWELGSGLGHVARFRPLAEILLRRGHRLIAVLRDLSRAEWLNLDVTYVQAPIKLRPDRREQQATSYADLLAAQGYRSSAELAVRAHAWRELFAAFRPELTIFDHSPTALLASSGVAGQRVLLGTGFACPPDLKPLPSLRPWLPHESAAGEQVEEEITRNINLVRQRWAQGPLDHLGELFREVDERILATYPELDAYPQRPGAVHWGTWPGEVGGGPPQWPNTAGPRVFAYLKPFPAVAALLQTLGGSPCSALVYAPELDRAALEPARSPQIEFSARPLDFSRVLAECDAVVANGSHATAAAALLAGKPALHFPTVLEQFLNARNVAQLGAGLVGPSLEPERLGHVWDTFWKSGGAPAARDFAARHQEAQPGARLAKVAARIEELLASRPAQKRRRGKK